MDLSEKPLPLRGPSLPGSLGVRVREEWEPFEEENTGIDLRFGNCKDSNVQIDLMKETESNGPNKSDCAAFSEDFDMDQEASVQRDAIEGQIICKVKDRSKWETFDEENKDEETDLKCPVPYVRPATIPFNNAAVPKDSHDPQEVVPSPNREVDFSLNSSFLIRPSTSKYHPLPSGKKYHVFFSYEMADRDWVHSVVERMESEHGYRCSFHERDFHGGKRVIENIMEHIQWSVKTVLVLSPDFLESSWCQFEMKQGLHESIEEARMLIVPVMVRECEVPDTLRSLTYIDATPGTDWWDRFLEAVAAQDTLQVCNDAGNQIAIQPRYENFAGLCEISSNYRCCCGETFDVAYVPEELNRPGIQISHEEFSKTLSTLKEALEENCVNRFFCDYIPCCSIQMTLICSWTLGSFIYFVIAMVVGFPSTDVVMISAVLPWSTLASFLFLFFLQIHLRKKKIRKAGVELNRQLYGSKTIIDVKFSTICQLSSLRVKINFRYYDFQSCMIHLQEFMSSADETFEETRLSVYSEQLVITMLEEYLRDYQDGKLKLQRGSSPRHVRHAKCLCQYIEDELQNQEQWMIFCQRKLGNALQGIP